MAETEGGGTGYKAILTRRVAGVPVYVYGLLAVGILAWYLKRRAAQKAAEKASNPSSSTVGDVTSQTMPSAYPSMWSSDVFVHNYIPETPAATGGDATPVTSPTQKYVHVQAGQSIVDTITTLQQGGWSGTWDTFIKLNPEVGSNITWGPASNPNLGYDLAARRQDKFTKEATYKLA